MNRSTALRGLPVSSLLAVSVAASLSAASASAQTTLSVKGTLVIDGGGENTQTERYSGTGVIASGSDQVTIRLSSKHPTLVIRGTAAFGDSCNFGYECFSTDKCDDKVCGWTGVEVAYEQCGSPASLAALDSTLDDCVRLWAVDNTAAWFSAHQDKGTLLSLAKRCMAAGSQIDGASAIIARSCPQLQKYQDAYSLLLKEPADVTGTHRNVLNKALGHGLTISVNDTSHEAARVTEIKNLLAVIEEWFKAQVARRGSVTSPGLFAEVSETVGRFWKSAYVGQVIDQQAAPVDEADAAAIAARIQKSGFNADRQVLSAAFDPDMPLQTAPLLLIVADALTGLAERTNSFASLQDIVCRVRPCFSGRTRLGNYMKVLGTLAQGKAALSAAIELGKNAPAEGEPDVRTEANWASVFTLMSTQHIALENAVRSARDGAGEYKPENLEDVPLPLLPVYTRPLATLIQHAKTASDAFEATGTFKPRYRSVRFGLDADRNEKIAARVNEYCASPGGTVPAAISAYKNNEKEYISHALSVAQSATAEEKGAQQLAALRERVTNLLTDMNGLRVSKQLSEMQFGDFMAKFAEIAPTIADRAQQIDLEPGKYDLNIGASHARLDANSVPTDITQVAVRRSTDLDGKPADETPWVLSRLKGDTVHFGISGRWAPSCSLRGFTMPNKDTVVVTDDNKNDLLTGPEGYTVAVTKNGSVAKTVSSGSGHEAYVNAQAALNGCYGFDLPVLLRIKAEACLSLAAGAKAYWNGGTQETDGGTSLNSFSWSQGIRLKDTPFPDQPAGSLLLVEMPAGKTALTDVRRVQVLIGSNFSVLVNDASDYYLVVNDKSCSPVSAQQLALRVVATRSSGDLALSLARAMADSMAALRSSAKYYVAQGRLLAGQPEELRRQALLAVKNATNQTSLDPFAEILRDLFEAFIAKQIADIDREIQLVNLERQVAALISQEKEIELEIAAAMTAGLVASLQGGLAVRELDVARLEAMAAELGDLSRDWMEPVLSLRLAGDLEFSAAQNQLLDRLTTLSPSAKYTDNLDLVCPAVNVILDKIETDRLVNPPTETKVVVFSIPNTDSTAVKPEYREVDATMAKNAWSKLSRGEDLDFTVTPELFYEAKEPYSLSCMHAAPTVLSMAYVLVTPSLTQLPTFTSETTWIAPDMKFPRDSELFSYRFDNTFYLSPQVEILSINTSKRFGSGGIDQLIGGGGTYWLTPVARSLRNKGTSPFTSYHVDLSRIANSYPRRADGSFGTTFPFHKNNAVALLVAFQVETVPQAATRLAGVRSCQ